MGDIISESLPNVNILKPSLILSGSRLLQNDNQRPRASEEANT